jgi:double-stranded uracil-DNA glycosylase
VTTSKNVSNVLQDFLAPSLRVVFCGINPGLRAAAPSDHFAGRGNRFWKTIHLAGFTQEEIAPDNGALVLAHRYGLTTAVEGPSSRADGLSRDEFERAASGLSAKIARYSPEYIAFLGKTGLLGDFGKKSAVSWGRQDELIGGSKTWILPNPSGLNRSFNSDELVPDYARRSFQVTAPHR